MRNYTPFRGRTVRRGSTSATSSAIFMASIDGLRSTGNSLGRVELGRFGFMVSKHRICSKQSFKPSRSNTLTAWVLSEFVKIWNKFKHNLVLVKIWSKFKHNLVLVLWFGQTFYLGLRDNCSQGFGLTIFLWVMLRKRLRSWESGLIKSYGNLPCTKLWWKGKKKKNKI